MEVNGCLLHQKHLNVPSQKQCPCLSKRSEDLTTFSCCAMLLFESGRIFRSSLTFVFCCFKNPLCTLCLVSLSALGSWAGLCPGSLAGVDCSRWWKRNDGNSVVSISVVIKRTHQKIAFLWISPCIHAKPQQVDCWKWVMYLQCDLIGCFALRCSSSLVFSDVTGQCDQEVVTVAVGDQSRSGVTFKEIQRERGGWAWLLAEVRLRFL